MWILHRMNSLCHDTGEVYIMVHVRGRPEFTTDRLGGSASDPVRHIGY